MEDEMKATHALPEHGVEPEIKMEKQDSGGPEIGEGTQGAALSEFGRIKEVLSLEELQNVKKELEEGPSRNWDVQFHDFLKTLQDPLSVEENQQLTELRQWSRLRTSLVSDGASDANKWPRGLWVSPTLPHPVEEDQQEQCTHLDVMQSGKEASGVLHGDAIRSEEQRLQFRLFCYRKSEGPRKTHLQLQELCCQWLKPERHTKEQILDQLVLEQFLAILPPAMQDWLLEQDPETCNKAVLLAENFLSRQQKVEGWEQQITKVSEEEIVNLPKEREALPSTEKAQRFAETKQEDGGSVIVSGDSWLNKSKEEKPLLESPEPINPPRTQLETVKENNVLCEEEAEENQKRGRWQNGKVNEEEGDKFVLSQMAQREDKTSIHRDENRRNYEKCGESFGQSLRILTYKNIHKEEKLYKCWHCGKSFRSSSDLMTHERTHVQEKLYKCSLCGESERTHTGQKPHKCSHCGNTFGCNSQEGLNLGEKLYICSECGKSCSQRSDLLKHQRTHTGEKPCKCSACGKNFRNSSGLKVHQRIHTGEKPYKCSHCGKCFSWRSHFISHERIHTAFCSYCGKSFSQKTDLVEHERSHTADDGFSCFACSKSFEVSSELVIHARTHKEKPFECSVCGKTFRNSLQRIGHQKVHTGEKLHKCSHCGKSFNQRQSFITHERTHTGEKPHKCLVCGKSFRNIPNLKSHERTHTGEKPFKCSHCDKSFRWSSHLVLHERIHTGEKPYRCLVCGRTFGRPSNLLAHMRIHPGQKSYTCSDCGKNFTSKSSLLRHQKSHMGQELTTCSECGKTFRQQLNERDEKEGKVSVCSECVRSRYLSSDLVVRAEKKPFKCFECGKTFRNSSHLITHQSVHTRVRPYQCSDCGRNFVRRPNLLALPISDHGGQKPYKCSDCEKGFR